MDAKDLAFNNSGDAEVIKDVCAVLPRVSVAVFSDSFVVKTVGSRNLSRFVVSSEERDSVRIFEFQAHQVLESLVRVVAAVYVVAHKHVRGLRDLTTLVEELQ